MPIAPFTLDGRFEPGIVESAEKVSQELIETYKTPKSGASGRTEKATKEPANGEPGNKTQSRKRPLEEDTVERCRVVKRSRIRFADTSPRTPAKRLESPLSDCRVRDSSSPCLGAANAAMARTHTLSKGKGTRKDDSVLPARTSISEHAAFWQDLIHRQEQPGGLLNLQVEDVLRAPAIESALFCSGGAYLGQPFHVKTGNGKSMSPMATGDSSASTLLTSNAKSSRQGQTLSRPTVPWIDLRMVAKGSQRTPRMLRAKRLMVLRYDGIE
ncbi:hypothetical protein APHAL10511_000606 [Amanita phalloides]|nr:hypothetical protein APHAL10511_000606 [Amanita phalloides]